MKLRTKFAIVLLLIAIVLSGSVYGGFEFYKDQVVEGTREDVNETATLTADQLDASIEDQKDFVGFVASRPAAARFEESDVFLDGFVGNSRFFAAQIVDANGTIVDINGDVTQDVAQESIGEDVSDRPYVSTALSGKVFVSEPEYLESTGDYLVIFSAPIFEDRRLKGALAGGIYLDEQTFFGVLSPISRGDQRVTVTAGSETLYRNGGEFTRSIEASRTIDATGWTVTVTRDRSGLLEQLRQLALAQAIGLLLVMLSVVSFGAWEYRTTLTQTRKLLDGFAALQAGQFDHELTLAAAEEWEQIGRGFNALSASLGARESQLRQREQRLQVLNRVLRHNVRNIASVVLGYTALIRQHTDDEEVVHAVGRIEDAGWDLESLSEKARQLEYTMEERDGPTAIDVCRLLDGVLSEVREHFPDVDVNASCPEAAWISADPSLRVALLNLCENACQHNDSADPELGVAVERNGSTVEVLIRDNGSGIPEYEWTVIDVGEETPLEHGSGLGLWVAQWGVERSGGTLDVDPDDSTGATITVELAATEPPE